MGLSEICAPIVGWRCVWSPLFCDCHIHSADFSIFMQTNAVWVILRAVRNGTIYWRFTGCRGITLWKLGAWSWVYDTQVDAYDFACALTLHSSMCVFYLWLLLPFCQIPRPRVHCVAVVKRSCAISVSEFSSILFMFFVINPFSNSLCLQLRHIHLYTTHFLGNLLHQREQPRVVKLNVYDVPVVV